MKKLTTAFLVLTLVLGGVALAAAADAPQSSKDVGLSGLQKISDQEAQEIRGLGMGLGTSFGFGGWAGEGNPDCPQSLTSFAIAVDKIQLRDQIRLKDQVKDQSCK